MDTNILNIKYVSVYKVYKVLLGLNTDQNNSEYRHFLRSGTESELKKLLLIKKHLFQMKYLLLVFFYFTK